jgi:hypothetical protein
LARTPRHIAGDSPMRRVSHYNVMDSPILKVLIQYSNTGVRHLRHRMTGTGVMVLATPPLHPPRSLALWRSASRGDAAGRAPPAPRRWGGGPFRSARCGGQKNRWHAQAPHHPLDMPLSMALASTEDAFPTSTAKTAGHSEWWAAGCAAHHPVDSGSTTGLHGLTLGEQVSIAICNSMRPFPQRKPL